MSVEKIASNAAPKNIKKFVELPYSAFATPITPIHTTKTKGFTKLIKNPCVNVAA